MTWTAYFRDDTGTLVGYGTVPPESIPPGVSTLASETRMDQTNRWDPATRDWVPIPPEVLVDRLADLAAHPYVSDVWSRLTAPQRVKLRKLIVWLLGTKRFRHETEEVALDVDDTWPTDPANAVE